jgi:class 3 adenylate cyclase
VATQRKKLTVFFSDIRDFTATSDLLQPEALTEYLNEYFSEMTEIAMAHGATIDKYIGDAMMVFFGDPESKGHQEDAQACVLMAMAMQERMKDLAVRWKNKGFENPFVIRIGINTGYCNVGNFGSDQRLSYTIIGGEVNLTQRLESHSDPGGILMSYETYCYVQDLVEVEERQPVKMKGIARDVKTFAVLGPKKPQSPKTVALSHQAGVNIDLDVSTLTPSERQQLAEQLRAVAKQIS